jgi:hypothetical protein
MPNGTKTTEQNKPELARQISAEMPKPGSGPDKIFLRKPTRKCTFPTVGLASPDRETCASRRTIPTKCLSLTDRSHQLVTETLVLHSAIRRLGQQIRVSTRGGESHARW